MKDKIYKSFEDWFNKEDFHATGYDCNQVVSAKLAWNARNSEIQELKDKNNDLSNLLLKTESDLVNQVAFTGAKLLEIQELKDKIEKLKKENFALSAGCCEYLVGGDYGHETCKFREKLKELGEIE